MKRVWHHVRRENPASRTAKRHCRKLGDALKVALIAPSVDGRAVDDRANEACIEFFADLLDLPRSSVTVASGRSSRNKVIGISGCAVAELRDKLGN